MASPRDPSPIGTVYMMRRIDWSKDRDFNAAFEAHLLSLGMRVVWEHQGSPPASHWDRWSCFTRTWPPHRRLVALRLRKLAHALVHPRYALVALESKVKLVRAVVLKRRIRALARSAPVVLVGRSRGAWFATVAADDLPVAGVVCLGYPFQNPYEGDNPKRYLHLCALRTPTVIFQGERDQYGGLEVRERYELSPSIELRFIDTDHDFPTDTATIADIAKAVAGLATRRWCGQ